jgi:hypothetical protein
MLMRPVLFPLTPLAGNARNLGKRVYTKFLAECKKIYLIDEANGAQAAVVLPCGRCVNSVNTQLYCPWQVVNNKADRNNETEYKR